MLEQALKDLFPSDDPLDALDFDPVSYINSIFPTEQSLSKIESFKVELQQDSDRVSKELSEIVKAQAKLGEKTHAQLANSYTTIQELQEKVNVMKTKAQESEFTVEDICKDIRSLDLAKKNLTKTVTSLKRLAMLTHAVDQLADHCINKDYRKVAALLNASSDLLRQFSELKSSKVVSDLFKKREIIVRDLRLQLLEDFRDIKNTPPEVLCEACQVVDELGLELRAEIIKELSPHFLKSYDEIFSYGQMHSGLEHMDRRYAWLKRCFRDYSQNYQSIFPDTWQVTATISKIFCEKTRQHVNDNLEKTHIDTSIMVLALQKTLQLEQEISKKFSNYHIINSKLISIQFIPKHVNLGEVLGGYENLEYTQNLSQITPIPNFNGIISQVFENYMTRYCENEESSLFESIETFVNEDVHEETNIFPSSIRIFNAIKTKFNTCCSFNTGKVLGDLSKVFQKSLRYYHEKLLNKLPKPEKIGKIGEGEEILICLIINTAEYCQSTVMEMETTIRAKLEPAYEIECYQEKAIFIE